MTLIVHLSILNLLTINGFFVVLLTTSFYKYENIKKWKFVNYLLLLLSLLSSINLLISLIIIYIRTDVNASLLKILIKYDEMTHVLIIVSYILNVKIFILSVVQFLFMINTYLQKIKNKNLNI